jgi:hypothetical protein
LWRISNRAREVSAGAEHRARLSIVSREGQDDDEEEAD